MAEAGKVEIKITSHGHSYTMLGKNYNTEVKGAVLVSDAVVDDKQVQHLVDMAVNSVVKSLAEEIGKDLAKDFKKMYVRQVNKAVREHLTANKDKLIDKITQATIKEAEERFEDIYDDY